jgi:GNAT superfamily N-acetyltransferase
VLKSLGEPIGGINVVEIEETRQCVGVAYRIGKAWWRNGFSSEALSAVIKFLFEQVGVNRISAMHNTDNPNSGAVMRTCGMSYEGTKRQAGLDNQGVNDLAEYAILAENYFKHKTIATPETATCRSANESDYDAIIEMSRVWSSEHITRGLMTNSRENLAGLSLWVAEYGGKIVGYCSGVKKHAEDYSVFPPNVDYFEVDELYVLPDYRGNSIGQVLLSFTESELKKQGVSHFLLSSATLEQERISKFYKSCGYGVWITTFYK